MIQWEIHIPVRIGKLAWSKRLQNMLLFWDFETKEKRKKDSLCKLKTNDPNKKYIYMFKILQGQISKTRIPQHSKMTFEPSIYRNQESTSPSVLPKPKTCRKRHARRESLTLNWKTLSDRNYEIKRFFFFQINENLRPRVMRLTY